MDLRPRRPSRALLLPTAKDCKVLDDENKKDRRASALLTDGGTNATQLLHQPRRSPSQWPDSAGADTQSSKHKVARPEAPQARRDREQRVVRGQRQLLPRAGRPDLRPRRIADHRRYVRNLRRRRERAVDAEDRLDQGERPRESELCPVRQLSRPDVRGDEGGPQDLRVRKGQHSPTKSRITQTIRQRRMKTLFIRNEPAQQDVREYAGRSTNMREGFRPYIWR